MIKGISKTLAFIFIVILITTAGTCDFVWAEQRFLDHGNGTITDRKLELMWAKTDNQTDIFWDQVQSWLEDEFTHSIPQLYDDWRLPTVSELQSLFVEDQRYLGYTTDCGHPVKVVPQIRLSCILVWTADTALGLPLAFNFNLGSAFAIGLHENSGCRVLPVRSLKK